MMDLIFSRQERAASAWREYLAHHKIEPHQVKVDDIHAVMTWFADMEIAGEARHTPDRPKTEARFIYPPKDRRFGLESRWVHTGNTRIRRGWFGRTLVEDELRCELQDATRWFRRGRLIRLETSSGAGTMTEYPQQERT